MSNGGQLVYNLLEQLIQCQCAIQVRDLSPFVHHFHGMLVAEVHGPDGGLEVAGRIGRVIRSPGSPDPANIPRQGDKESLVQQIPERPDGIRERRE